MTPADYAALLHAAVARAMQRDADRAHLTRLHEARAARLRAIRGHAMWTR